MSIAARRNLLLALVAVFLGQTWMVYTDPAGRASPPLSPLAARGWDLWHAHNCQSCHQLYGFGGFLGPDLTNVAPKLTPARLDAILTEGSGRMPAFHLVDDDRLALARFLEELDQTGVGQARVPEQTSPATLLKQQVLASETEDDPFTPDEQQGLAILLEQNCIDCHLPNARSAYRATDLTEVTGKHDRAALARTLADGVSGTPMPRFVFSAEDVDAVQAILERMKRGSPAIRAAFARAEVAAEGALLALPWFEYSRPSAGDPDDESLDETPP